ncbi:MAG: putative metallopeptidase [Planctomycetia bacterium]
MARVLRPNYSPTPPFDFTLHMRRLCEDMTDRVPELRHINMSRVAISFSQARKKTAWGMYASLTPMRFENGERYTVRNGRKMGVQRVVDSSGREMFYILNFYLPRFLELDFDAKLATVIHELWHISPQFDGDLRRYEGRCFAHSASGEHDAKSYELARKWLGTKPPEELYHFLRYNFKELQERYCRIIGRKIPTPKLFPAG